MEQLLLIGSSETNGNQCTLALPSVKWFQCLRNDGLPNPFHWRGLVIVVRELTQSWSLQGQ